MERSIVAASVVTFAPAGGWAAGDASYEDLLRTQQDLLRTQLELHTQLKAAAPRAEELVVTPRLRRHATQLTTTNFEHIPGELLAHQMLGIASCTAAARLIENALSAGWTLDTQRITCPVRTALSSTSPSKPHN